MKLYVLENNQYLFVFLLQYAVIIFLKQIIIK